MNRIFLLFGVLFLLGSCGSEEIKVGQKTTLEVTPELYDAKDVIKGEVITAKFIVKNTGDHPLVISDVKGSCSCTVAEAPKEPLSPGEEAKIIAYINTDVIPAGTLRKTVRIVANTVPSVTKVIIKGNVIRK